MNDQIEKAVKILNQGGIIIFPTDTAFGIGCRIDNENAIERLFKIRKRPQTQPTPVLVSDIKTAEEYLLDLPRDVKDLMETHWPGALTVVYKCKKEKVPALVRGGGEKLGVRMPDNEIILEIIKGTNTAILGPSANFHGEDTPYALEDLDPKIVGLVDFVVKGECKLKKASTVVDCTKKPWKVLRKGTLEIII